MQNDIIINATLEQNNNTINASVSGNQNINGQISERGPQGIPGEAATIEIGTVQTGEAGSSASVTNSGTENAAVFNFVIPQGIQGETGQTGQPGATGNGIVNTEYISSSGLVDTYHVNYTNGNYDTFTVTNGQDGTGTITDVKVNNISVVSSDVANIEIKTINSNSIVGTGNIDIDALPSQTGQAGKFLSTDGTDASWESVPTRNIGEIVSSTIPLTDAGLHLLDGALIDGSGIYADFVDYIADLYDSGDYSAIFDTEANWQTAVTTYGVCGKFVYDSVNNTVRLPKIEGFIEGTNTISSVGDLIEAGLPNITGQTSNTASCGSVWSSAINTGCVYSKNTLSDGTNSPSGQGDSSKKDWAIDASRSSSIYGNSNTVQPQSIKVLYYIVIATTTKTDIQVDIDEIATDLNGKADVDLTNITDTGYIKMAGASMPSSTYIDLTLGASGTTYTAPADGYISVSKSATSSGQYLNVYSNRVSVQSYSTANGNNVACAIPVKKGSSIGLAYSVAGTLNFFRFIYAKGSESEAQ